jgi:hypothetical protein
MHLIASVVEVAHAEVGVLLRHVEEESVPIVFQHAQTLTRELDIPVDVVVPRFPVPSPVVVYAHIVVGIAEDHIDGAVGQHAEQVEDIALVDRAGLKLCVQGSPSVSGRITASVRYSKSASWMSSSSCCVSLRNGRAGTPG